MQIASCITITLARVLHQSLCVYFCREDANFIADSTLRPPLSSAKNKFKKGNKMREET